MISKGVSLRICNCSIIKSNIWVICKQLLHSSCFCWSMEDIQHCGLSDKNRDIGIQRRKSWLVQKHSKKRSNILNLKILVKLMNRKFQLKYHKVRFLDHFFDICKWFFVLLEISGFYFIANGLNILRTRTLKFFLQS